MPVLDWLGKDEALKTARKTPYRLLEEVPELGYGDKTTENMIVQGDNLEALKSLLPFYAGQVKCIYIDPPYNTGSAFEHYDDNLEHSVWLSMMYPRLELLKEFLREDGSIWINLDDNEVHYCKVVCDEIFGRRNFIGTIIWEKADSPRMDVQFFSTRHDHILVYAKNSLNLTIFRDENEEIPEHYNKVDAIGRRYYLKPMRVMGGNISESLFYPLIAPDGTEVLPYTSDGTQSCWRWSKKKIQEESERVDWVKGRNGWSPYFRIYADNRKGMPVQTIWTHEEAGSNRTSKKEINDLFHGNIFATPKPEKLISKVLKATTNKGELVLDSFLGSGTTAAVAHKMGRRYIGIEMGEHAKTHCVTRLKAVIDGEQGGISKSVNWQGGGGFRFYRLGNEIFDADGNINANISFENLAAHIWFTETKTPFNRPAVKSTFLGSCNKVAYALLYNGILKDKRIDGGNVLTGKTLQVILDDMEHQPYDKLIVYGESSRIGLPRLKSLNIEFKQTPYDIKAR